MDISTKGLPEGCYFSDPIDIDLKKISSFDVICTKFGPTSSSGFEHFYLGFVPPFEAVTHGKVIINVASLSHSGTWHFGGGYNRFDVSVTEVRRLYNKNGEPVTYCDILTRTTTQISNEPSNQSKEAVFYNTVTQILDGLNSKENTL